MAISTNSRGGRRPGRDLGALSEINVTPFVDVVLVLLIIFMLTAHVVDHGLDINVPQTKTVASDSRDLPIVDIAKDGTVAFGKLRPNIAELPELIHQKFGPKVDAVFVRADKDVRFDIVAQILSVLGEAKLPVSVVTQPIGRNAR